MQVAIVGAGINGLSAARSLARRGHEVTVYEQFALDHTRGSSHGRSRIFRFAYPEPAWVRLAQKALGGWRELERETGEQLLELTGIVEVVRNADEGSRRALEACGVPFEVLSATEAEARFPVLRLPDGLDVLYQAEAGVAYASRARRAFLASARAHGAELREEHRVAGLDDLDGDVVVVTAGSWARELLGRAGIELPVAATSETVCYFELQTEGPIPSVVDFKWDGKGHGTYALHDPVHGLKLGIHGEGLPVDPDRPLEPDDRIVRRVRKLATRYFPTASPEPAAIDTCLYTSTNDERFILERHGRIVVGSACSGHGFKFAPVVGERLADLAEASNRPV